MFPPWEKLSQEESEEEAQAGEGKGDGLRMLEVVPQTTSGQEREVGVRVGDGGGDGVGGGVAACERRFTASVFAAGYFGPGWSGLKDLEGH